MKFKFKQIIVYFLILITSVCMPVFAAREYYIEQDYNFGLKFMCFNEH